MASFSRNGATDIQSNVHVPVRKIPNLFTISTFFRVMTSVVAPYDAPFCRLQSYLPTEYELKKLAMVKTLLHILPERQGRRKKKFFNIDTSSNPPSGSS